MGVLKDPPQVQRIVQEIDRLIAEMTTLRSQVAALVNPPSQPEHSVRETEYIGIWTDRKESPRAHGGDFLLSITSLGASGYRDVSERAEKILATEINPQRGWSVQDDGAP